MNFLLLILIVFGSLFFSPVVVATENHRKIIAFYDPEEAYNDFYFTNLHQRAQMPLNHLGLDVIPWSVDRELPSTKELEGVLGFVTWFHRADAFEDADPFCSYLDRQMNAGFKWLTLGELGLYNKKKSVLSPICQKALATLGIKSAGNPSQNPYYLDIVKKNARMVEFERPLQLSENISYHHYKILDTSAKSYLTIKRTDIKNSNSEMVVSTSKGGFIAPSVGLYYVKSLDKAAWRVNPFLFFEEALGLKGIPRPDVTTMNGTRLFFSHIDGDGIVNLSHIDQSSYTAAVIYKKVLTQYSHLPITVSLITGYFDLPEYHTSDIQDLYVKMFSLPNVEPSSHGYAHPLNWKKKTVALEIPNYIYSPLQEINGSLAQINTFLKDKKINKTARLYQWTGDCLPDDEAIKLIKAEGLLNINGGDSRFDARHDSYAWVSPLGITRNGVLQVYTGAPNENVYTNLWRGPFYGYREVIESFKNTETPRRLKPINVYYHFYSGEKLASLMAVQQAYEYAQSQKILPLFTSEYAGLVQDFKNVKINSDETRSVFRISNKGLMRTIRFDDEPRFVDMNKSDGVLGFDHYQNSLYVHLTEADLSTIVLQTEQKKQFYLQSANFQIKNWSFLGNRIKFSKKGWGVGSMELKGLDQFKEVMLGDEYGAKKFKVVDGVVTVHFEPKHEVDWVPVELILEPL